MLTPTRVLSLVCQYPVLSLPLRNLIEIFLLSCAVVLSLLCSVAAEELDQLPDVVLLPGKKKERGGEKRPPKLPGLPGLGLRIELAEQDGTSSPSLHPREERLFPIPLFCGLSVRPSSPANQTDEEILVDKQKPRKCSGCGAQLQTANPNAVGYRLVVCFALFVLILAFCKLASRRGPHRPERVLKQEERGRRAVCQRCHSLRYHGIVTPLKVPYEELKEYLRMISTQSCLVVKIVDIFDFSGSFIQNFRNIAGNNPIVLVGNKVMFRWVYRLCLATNGH